MCVWCEEWGYWECDGEGGDCQGSPGGDDHCVETPPQGGWRINCTKTLRYTNGNPVPDPGNPQAVVKVHIVGMVTPQGLTVRLNGKAVPIEKDGEKPRPPTYPDDRGTRDWVINTPFALPWPMLEQEGDDPKREVQVRVQAYRYKADSHRNPPPHPQGEGPKIRVIGGVDPNDSTAS